MSSQNTKITKTLSTFSERVKMIDMHPREPLVICSLFSGQITLWNYDTMTLVKTFEVVDQPIRCVKFITRLQSFACGADDMAVRVYNYNTMEKTKTFAAHDDYIRSIGVHDQMPLMITSSDDMRIKGWDWTKDWACTMIFEGHTHYVMMVAFNPKEPLTFASASLDQTVKVWNVSNPEPFFSLNGHEDGVNCVEYYPKGDKPYLISGSDDHTVKVWDYQTRACIQTLTHHVHNVTCVFFHPDVPLLFSGSEDETIGVINTQTWRQEQTMNMGMQRAWTIAARPNTNAVAIGFDRGMIVLKVGNDVPILSMDANGKLYQALGNEVVRTDIKNVPADTADGETVRFAVKELGNCESAPTAIYHGPSGQYVAVLTEAGEFTIYSTLAWRPKTFGQQCTSFVWGMDSSSYAILEGDSTLKMFKGFKQGQTVRLREAADKLFAGPVLGVRSSGAITFYTWDTQRVVRRVEGTPSHVLWSDSNELVALVMENGLFILRYNADDVAEHFANGGEETEEGLEVAFTVVDEVVEKVRQAVWVGDCLAFVNSNDRLNYYIGGEVTNIAVVGRQTYLLGFLPKENRLFCIDKERNITSYLLHVSVIEYKTAIVREDFETAAEILPRVPASAKDKVAQFLQARGHLELALDVATEDDHRFELAVQLGRLEVAIAICRKIPSSFRWKQIGDLALESGAFDIAEQAMLESGDYNGLLLLYTSTGDMGGMEKLAALALAKGKTNVAFTCCHLANKYAECTDILVQTGRIADAAFYARTYCHSKVQDVVLKWKNSVAGLPRVRESIADPVGFPNLFPGMSASLQQASASPPQKEKEQTPSPDKVRSPVKQQQTPAASAFDNYRKDSTFSEESPASPPPTPYTGVKPPDARAPPPSAAAAAAIAAAAVAGSSGTTTTPKTPADLFSPAPPKAPQVTPATAYRTTQASPDDTATPMIVKAARTAAEETAGKLEYDSPGKRAPGAGEGSVPRPAAPLAKHKKDDDAPRPPPKHADPVADDDLDAMLGEDDTIAQKYAPKAAGSVGATKSASPTSPSGVAAASHVAVSSGSPRQPLPPASDTDEDLFKEDDDWQ